MKKLTPIVLSLLLFSCSIDHEDRLESNTNLQAQEQQVSNEETETQLQWFSYITANVLLTSEEAQQELNNLIDIYGNSIPAGALVGINSQAPNFNAAFRTITDQGITLSNGRPDGADGRPEGPIPPVTTPPPPPPPPPTSAPGAHYVANDYLIDIYIDFLTEDNCVELYFPTTIDFSTVQYSTTSHPMNNLDDTNNGHILYYPLGEEADRDQNTTVEVSPAYVGSHANIIVARPYDGSNGSRTCDTANEYALYNVGAFLN